jgi:hypothetical protein
MTTTSATTTMTTTMITASTTSTSIAATVKPTPNHDNCVLDADRTFGNVSADAVPVSFYFELETDPALGASLHEVMNMLERTILVDLLPNIFGNNCNITTNRLLRSSTFVPVCESVGPGATLVLGGKIDCLLVWMYDKWTAADTKLLSLHRKLQSTLVRQR